MLAAAYPAGAFAGAIPSGLVAARAGVKPTVLVGLALVSVCTILFALSGAAWEIDLARFAQGVASAFAWTGAIGWLVAAAPAHRRGSLIGRAFAAAVVGALFGPVIGGIASFAGIGWTFGAVAVASLGLVACAVATPAPRPTEPQGVGPLLHALGDRRVLGAFWFVFLPALLFGVLTVLAPLRLSALGFGAVAIGAVFLCSAAFEAVNNVLVGHLSDRVGPARPITFGLVGSTVVAALLPWPGDALLLAPLVVCGGIAFGTFFTPGMTLLTNLAEERGLQYGWASALINLAWAPGQALGASGSGALAHATTDAVPYLGLAGICALSLWRLRGSTFSTMQPAPASSGSSSHTTAGG